MDKKFSLDVSEGTLIPNLVQIKQWGLLGKQVKCNKNYLFIYLYLFLRLDYR